MIRWGKFLAASERSVIALVLFTFVFFILSYFAGVLTEAQSVCRDSTLVRGTVITEPVIDYPPDFGHFLLRITEIIYDYSGGVAVGSIIEVRVTERASEILSPIHIGSYIEVCANWDTQLYCVASYNCIRLIIPPPPPPPPPSTCLLIAPKSSSLKCNHIGKNARLKFNANNVCSIPVTIISVTENSPNFYITGFKVKTIKPGKSKTISVKVQCSAVGFFPPPFGVTFTTSDGKTVGPAGYDISVAPALVGRFSLDGVGVAVSKERVRFFAWGSGIKSIGAQVWDLTGKLIFSKEESGSVLAFNDRTLANGVYLYIARVRGFNGEVYVSEVRKLVIVR